MCDFVCMCRWDECKASSEVLRLVQKGIPTSLRLVTDMIPSHHAALLLPGISVIIFKLVRHICRGNIWCKMVRNMLQITPEVYQDHLDEALKMYDSNGRLSLLAPPDELDDIENLKSDDFEKEKDAQAEGFEETVKLPADESNDMSDKVVSNVSGSDLSASSVMCQVVSSNAPVTSADSFSEAPLQLDRNSITTAGKLELLIASMTLIQRDIPRTFPTLSFFHDDGPLAASLDHVLKAYACYEPTIGYVQV